MQLIKNTLIDTQMTGPLV